MNCIGGSLFDRCCVGVDRRHRVLQPLLAATAAATLMVGCAAPKPNFAPAGSLPAELDGSVIFKPDWNYTRVLRVTHVTREIPTDASRTVPLRFTELGTPVIEIALLSIDGSRRETVVAEIDTGGHFGLHVDMRDAPADIAWIPVDVAPERRSKHSDRAREYTAITRAVEFVARDGVARIRLGPVETTLGRGVERAAWMLGIDVLAQFDAVLFDWEAGSMRILAAEDAAALASQTDWLAIPWRLRVGGAVARGAAAPSDSVGMRVLRGLPYVDGWIGSHPVNVIVDTGSSVLLAVGDPALVTADRSVVIVGFDGTNQVSAGRLAAPLRIADHELGPLAAVVTPHMIAADEIVIGMPFLRRQPIVLDFAGERVLLRIDRAETDR